MRRTASRAHSIEPITLMSNIRRHRAMSISSTLALTSTTPALFTRPSRGPSLASICLNMASTCASLATSACTAMALPPAGPDGAHHLVGCQRVRGVVHRHRPARSRGEQGRRCADAAAAAGDQQCFVHNLSPAKNAFTGYNRSHAPWKPPVHAGGTAGMPPQTSLQQRQEKCMRHSVDYYLAPKAPGPTWDTNAVAMVPASGAAVRVLPMDLGDVFSISGGLPLRKRAPQRQAYRLLELQPFQRGAGRAAERGTPVFSGARTTLQRGSSSPPTRLMAPKRPSGLPGPS